MPRTREINAITLTVSVKSEDSKLPREKEILQQRSLESKRHAVDSASLLNVQAIVLERQHGEISFAGSTLAAHWARQRCRMRGMLPPDSEAPLLVGYCYLAVRSILRLTRHQRATMGVFFWLLLPLWPVILVLAVLAVPVVLALLGVMLLAQSAIIALALGLCSEGAYTSLSLLTLNWFAHQAHTVLQTVALGDATNARQVSTALMRCSQEYDAYYRLMVRAHYHNFIVGPAIYQGLVVALVESGTLTLRGTGAEWLAQLLAPSLLVLVLLVVPGAARCAILTKNSGRPPVRDLASSYCVFYVGDCFDQRRKLDDVLREFVAGEHGNGIENLKYSAASQLVSGQPFEATVGLNRLLCVPIKELWSGMGRGLDGIMREFEQHGSDVDRQCMHYVLHEKAGQCSTRWEHAGGLLMDAFPAHEVADGRVGKGLEYFVQHANALEAELIVEHVVALRLYTTAAYSSINNPLRSATAGRPHPLAITVAYLTDGIKRLRAVNATRDDRDRPCDFWRGMRNLEVPKSFAQEGGTEQAPMSTSSNINIALQYSNKAQKRVLFKVHTIGFMDRGADLQFLSAFPAEVEYLYPPLTFLKPRRGMTGELLKDTVQIDGIDFTVIEVQPHIAT